MHSRGLGPAREPRRDESGEASIQLHQENALTHRLANPLASLEVLSHPLLFGPADVIGEAVNQSVAVDDSGEFAVEQSESSYGTDPETSRQQSIYASRGEAQDEIYILRLRLAAHEASVDENVARQVAHERVLQVLAQGEKDLLPLERVRRGSKARLHLAQGAFMLPGWKPPAGVEGGYSQSPGLLM